MDTIEDDTLENMDRHIDSFNVSEMGEKQQREFALIVAELIFNQILSSHEGIVPPNILAPKVADNIKYYIARGYDADSIRGLVEKAILERTREGRGTFLGIRSICTGLAKHDFVLAYAEARRRLI